MPLKNQEEMSDSSINCHRDTNREQFLLKQMKENV